MKTLIFPFCLVFSILAYAQKDDIAIIPEPVSLVKKDGSFNLKDNTVINLIGNDKDAIKAVDYLTASISGATGFKWVVKNSAAGSAINLSILASKDNELGTEGYKLVVSPQSVSISANQAAGLFYGVQTFLQLLPTEIESKKVIKNICIEI